MEVWILTLKSSVLHVWQILHFQRICRKPPPGVGLDQSCVWCRFTFFVLLKNWSDMQVTRPQNSSGWKAVLDHLLQPPPQAGSNTAGCIGLCLLGFWISPRAQTLQPLLATYDSVWSPTQQKKKMFFFLCFSGISCISVCLIASCPITGYHWEKPGSVCFNPCVWYLYTLIRSPLSACPGSQPLLTRQMLQAQNHFSDPSLRSPLYVHVSLALGSPGLATALQMVSSH